MRCEVDVALRHDCIYEAGVAGVKYRWEGGLERWGECDCEFGERDEETKRKARGRGRCGASRMRSGQRVGGKILYVRLSC